MLNIYFGMKESGFLPNIRITSSYIASRPATEESVRKHRKSSDKHVARHHHQDSAPNFSPDY